MPVMNLCLDKDEIFECRPLRLMGENTTCWASWAKGKDWGAIRLLLDNALYWDVIVYAKSEVIEDFLSLPQSVLIRVSSRITDHSYSGDS
jgi:hypothetical protein